MSGTRSGGIQARDTNKKKYGEDFYREIGRKGGLKGRTGGFYANRELARIAGAKGGRISRRGKAKEVLDDTKDKQSNNKVERKRSKITKLFSRGE